MCSFLRGGLLLGIVCFELGMQKGAAQCEDKTGWQKVKCQAAQLGRATQQPLPGSGLDVLMGPVIRELVSPNAQPITTSFADARRSVTLPETFSPGSFEPFAVLGRTQDGAFLLRPGAYEGVFQSYCLHAGTYGPSKGDGYCPAPLLGPKAEMARTILRQSVFHPDVQQHDVQLLLWAIIARADYQHMPPQMQRTASALLPPALLEQLKGGPLSRLPDTLRQPLERKLQQEISTLGAPMQRVLRAESDIRQQVSTSATYEVIERTAVLAGLIPEDPAAATVPRGIWIQHPQGYFVRYLPEGYSRTKIQVFVPDAAAPRARAALFVPAAYSAADEERPLVFDPSEEVATPANTAAQRLAQSMRYISPSVSCPAMYTSVAAGDTLMPRPASLSELPKPDFWNLFWAMFNRSPIGVFLAGVFTPSEIADDELENALQHCPPSVREEDRQRKAVMVNRGVNGNNPSALRFDPDGLSTFEVLLKPYPCIITFAVAYKEPKIPGVAGAVSTVSSRFASFPILGTAIYTPQFDAPGIGMYHWSLNFQDSDSLKPLLKQLCPNSVFK